MSPGNTPTRAPFNTHPDSMGMMGHGTPWKFSSYHAATPNRSAHQMGDYNPSFPSAPPRSNPFIFNAPQSFTSGAPDTASHLDPSQIPLPSTSDADLCHGPSIAGSIGYASTSKVAGARRAKVSIAKETTTSQAKGKRKHEDSSSSGSESDYAVDEPLPKKTTHGGRRAGAGNYGNDELQQLLRLTEKELPVGQNGWKRIHQKYSVWAAKHSHSPRDAKSLEAKFKMMVKTKKPTGSGKRPETITRAKAIDKLINEKVGTRNLNDSEIDNEEEDEEYTSDIDLDSKKHIVIARSDKNEVPTTRRTRGNQTADLALKLASSLDPEAQRLRDEERANRSFQNTHIFMLSQQLRDANTTIETLRSELSMVRDHLHHVERARDQLDTKLNFERKMAGIQARNHGTVSSSHKYNPELTRVRGKVRKDEFFPGGGQMSTWVSDGSSASDWDENKENVPFAPIIHSPTVYKPQHLKYKLERSSPKLPSPPTSSPFTAGILSNSSFHASTSTGEDLFNITASPLKPSFS